MPNLPGGYRVERDPDVLVLRADRGRFVAAFSSMGTTEDAVRETAWEDYRAADRGRVRRRSGRGLAVHRDKKIGRRVR